MKCIQYSTNALLSTLHLRVITYFTFSSLLIFSDLTLYEAFSFSYLNHKLTYV